MVASLDFQRTVARFVERHELQIPVEARTLDLTKYERRIARQGDLGSGR